MWMAPLVGVHSDLLGLGHLVPHPLMGSKAGSTAALCLPGYSVDGGFWASFFHSYTEEITDSCLGVCGFFFFFFGGTGV
jgi:hypothetical protein